MSRARAPGDGPKCACGAPAVWSGFCQMEDGLGYCGNACKAPQLLFPSDAIPRAGAVYALSMGPPQQREQRERFERLRRSLDELVAAWIDVTGKAPSQATVFELMQWTNEQT